MPPPQPKRPPTKLAAKAVPKYNQLAAMQRNARSVAQAKAATKVGGMAYNQQRALFRNTRTVGEATRNIWQQRAIERNLRTVPQAMESTYGLPFGESMSSGMTPPGFVQPAPQAAAPKPPTGLQPPWWANQISPQEWTSRHRVRNILGPLAKPTFVRPQPEGYTEAVPPSYPGGGEAGYGGGGGYGGGFVEFPTYTPKTGGGYGVYAPLGGEGANPMRTTSPRWWHNRLTWRF